MTPEAARDRLSSAVVNYVGEAVGEYNDRGRRALKRGKTGDYREACQYFAAFRETIKKLGKETRDLPGAVCEAWSRFASQELAYALYTLGRGELAGHAGAERRPGCEGPVDACATLKAALDLDPGLAGPHRSAALGDLAAALDGRGAPRAAVLAARDGQVAAMAAPEEVEPAGVFDRARRAAPPARWTDADARVRGARRRGAPRRRARAQSVSSSLLVWLLESGARCGTLAHAVSSRRATIKPRRTARTTPCARRRRRRRTRRRRSPSAARRWRAATRAPRRRRSATP